MRVRSIALVHEMLYQRENLTSISFKDYVWQLASDLFLAYHVSQTTINLRVTSNGMYLGLNSAVPFGIILTELITNALKYAPSAPIDVLLSQVGDHILISFIDHGPGIPKESLPLIFERFYRVRNEKTVTGTGLGLYICRQIIEAHRGKIWAESTLGQGTTFFIELPINSQT